MNKTEFLPLALTDNAETVLKTRYLHKNAEGQLEETSEDLFHRVAKTIAAPEMKYNGNNKDLTRETEVEFFNMMASGRYMPNSPTLMNAGRDMGMLSACFVLPIGDSIREIGDNILNTMLVQKAGGGTGFSFDRLRPTGDYIASSGGTTSGPIPFWKQLSETTNAIQQGAFRRGANMGMMTITHPDILSFMFAKQDLTAFQNFNISIKLTDDWMNDFLVDPKAPHQVINYRSGERYLLPKTLKPGNYGIQQLIPVKSYSEMEDKPEVWSMQDMMDAITKCAWATGEPGVIFIDTINKHNMVPNVGMIEATNPCLTGDTLVAVADGRHAVRFDELAKEGKDIPVYCMDDSGTIRIRTMRNPRITGYNKKVLKITFENGTSVRCTENHKWRLRNGVYVEARELSVGNSLCARSKFSRQHGVHRDCSYWYVQRNNRTTMTEQRLMYNELVGPVPKEMDVHHINENPSDNRIENFALVEHHQHLSEHRIGDKNPMRIYPESNHFNDPASQQRMREKNHIGATRSEETKRNIGATTLEHFKSEDFRKAHSDGVKQSWIDKRDNYIEAFSKRSDEQVKRAQELTDLPVFSSHGNGLMVKKHCETCGCEFETRFEKREQAFCSYECAANSKRVKEAQAKTLSETCSKQRNTKKDNLVDALTKYICENNMVPSLLDLNPICKTIGLNDIRSAGYTSYVKLLQDMARGYSFDVPYNFAELRDDSVRKTIANDFVEHGMLYNHKIASIEMCGEETVYNGTVDDFHNFCVAVVDQEACGKVSRYGLITCRNCGEQPLLPFQSCNLLSININKHVVGGKLDEELLRETIRSSVKFLDNVIDANKYPIPQIDKMSKTTRNIGLGVMGFADALYALGIAYNSEAGIEFGRHVMQIVQDYSHDCSIELAEQRGAFPAWEGSRWDTEKHIKIRNAATTTVAPTGTVSIIADCSGGIEPMFSLAFIRKVMGTQLIEVNKVFEAYAKEKGFYSEALMERIAKEGTIAHIDEIDDETKRIFVCAHDIAPEWHLKMQAAFQENCDSSISKTVNMPNSAKMEEVTPIYIEAWKLGCKGVTVYRDGSRGNQPMSLTSTTNPNAGKERPKELEGDMYFKTVKGHAYFIAIGLMEGRVYEVFVGNLMAEKFNEESQDYEMLRTIPKHVKKGKIVQKNVGKGHAYVFAVEDGEDVAEYPLTDRNQNNEVANSVTRQMSAGLRYTTPIEVHVDQLEKSSSDMTSFSKTLAHILKTYIPNGTQSVDLCPTCKANGIETKMIYEEGCKKCPNCLISKCG
jgi:ribonucleotide reductase alpha subunit